MGWYAVAIAVGMQVANILMKPDGPKTTTEGPRITDLKATGSSYGSMIPILHGTVRLAGNIIWSAPIREQKTSTITHTGGSKKGAAPPQQTANTYAYYGTFALGLGQGPASSVLRIWADSKIIYDATSGADTLHTPGLAFRFYHGDEEQLPDSIMESWVGVGSAPAYRGICYILFDDIPLADYGNRFPNLTCEIAALSVPAHHTQPLVAPSWPGTYYASGVVIDYLRGIAFAYNLDAGGVRRFDLSSMTVELGVTNTANNAPGGGYDDMAIDSDGYLYGMNYYFEGLTKLDPNTLRPLKFVPHNAIDYYLEGICCGSLHTLKGDRAFLVIGTHFGTSVNILDSDLNRIPFIDEHGSEQPNGTIPGNERCGTLSTLVGDNLGIVTIVCRTSRADDDLLHITEIVVSLNHDGRLVWGLGRVVVIASGDFKTPQAKIGYSPSHFVADFVDNSVIFQMTMVDSAGNNHWYIAKISSAGGIVWVAPARYGYDGGQPGSQVNGGNYIMASGKGFASYDSRTGQEVALDETWPNPAYQNVFVFDGLTNIVISGIYNHIIKYYVSRDVGSATNLGQITAAVMRLAGYSDDEFDTTDIDTLPVVGFILSSQATAAASLSSLLLMYQIDVVESDYRVHFRSRGKQLRDVLPDMRAIPDKDGEAFKETRQQEIELPASVTITYIDQALTYQTNTQSASRPRNPIATVQSANMLAITVPAVFLPNMTAQGAERVLYAAWTARHKFVMQVSWDWLWLDVGDSVALTVASTGYTVLCRIITLAIGVDFTLQLELSVETSSQYVSIAEGSHGHIGTQAILSPVITELTLLDVPLLQDADALPDATIRGYWLAGPIRDVPWQGATLESAPDRVQWAAAGTTVTEAVWGRLTSKLADAYGVYRTTRDSFTVSMSVGGKALASIDDGGMAGGYNAAAVLKNNGEVEVIQFKVALQVSESEWRLSQLNRGRRGTDTMAGGYIGGEKFVLLRSAYLNPLSLSVSLINQLMLYRATTYGGDPTLSLVQGHTLHGRDKMPYAPVQLTAKAGQGGISLAWKRRSRTDSGIIDGTGDSVLELDMQGYEIDILSPAGRVLRTISAPDSQVLYDTGSVNADFSNLPLQLTAIVYQMSSIVGRGFGLAATVKVH